MKGREIARIKSGLLSDWLVPAFAAASALALGATANAATAPVTFAQVIEASTNANPNAFEYVNNGAGNDAEFGTDVGGVLGAPIPVNFTYLSVNGPLPADLTGVQNATLTMTSSTKSPVVTAFDPIIADQPITGGGNLTDTLTITRDTPASEGAGARDVLLSMTFTGNLMGDVGGTAGSTSPGGATPQLAGNSGLGDTVIYSSDFVNFASSTQQDYSLSFSSWDPLTTPPTGLGIASDNYYNTATAAGVGTFDYQGTATVIPEPNGIYTEAMGAFLLLAIFGRRGRSLFVGMRSNLSA